MLTDDYVEDSNPSGKGHVVVPVIYCCYRHSDLERKYNGPLENVIPTHCESIRGIEESICQSVETAGDWV